MESNNYAVICKSLGDRGNKIFKSARDDLPPILVVSRLEEAIRKYRQALLWATNSNDKASLLKNIGVASIKLALKSIIASNNLSINHDFLHVKYYLKDGIGYLSQGYLHGKSLKSTEWKTTILDRLFCLLEEIQDLVAELSFQRKILLIEECAYALTIDHVRARYFLRLAEIIFYEAHFQFYQRNIRKMMVEVRNCYCPVEEASKFEKDDKELNANIRVLREGLRVLTCKGEAWQALDIGMYFE